jgi:hypothetical protein
MKPDSQKNPIAAASAATVAAAEALKKHGAEARTISRDFLVQRQGAIEQELVAAFQRVEAAKEFLTRMQGALADTKDLIKALDAAPPPNPADLQPPKPPTPSA